MSYFLTLQHALQEYKNTGGYSDNHITFVKCEGNTIEWNSLSINIGGDCMFSSDVMDKLAAFWEYTHPETILKVSHDSYTFRLAERFAAMQIWDNPSYIQFLGKLRLIAGLWLESKPVSPYSLLKDDFARNYPSLFTKGVETQINHHTRKAEIFAGYAIGNLEEILLDRVVLWFSTNIGHNYTSDKVAVLLANLQSAFDVISSFNVNPSNKLTASILELDMILAAKKYDSLIKALYFILAREEGNKAIRYTDVIKQVEKNEERLVKYIGKKPTADLKKWLAKPEGDGLVHFGDALYRSEELASDPEISTDDYSVFRTMARYFRSKPEKALEDLKKSAGRYGSDVAALFNEEIVFDKDQASVIKSLRRLVGEFPLPPEKAKTLKEQDEKKYKKYLDLRKNALAQYKAALQSIIRGSGENLMMIPEVIKRLKKAGIEWYPSIPEAWKDGAVDENAKLYTNDGKELSGTYSGGEVKVNSDSSSDWVIMYKPEFAQGWTRIYKAETVKQNKDEKYEIVKKFMKDAEKVRAKWMADVKKGVVPAILVETVYQTQGRIGANASSQAAGKRTYGLSTLMKKHFAFRPDGSVRISYIGKKGVRQVHMINMNSDTKPLLVQLKKLYETAENPTDFVFTDKSVRSRRVGSNEVNSYIKSLGVPFTVHKFRHMKGTALAQQLIDESPLMKRKTQVDQKQAADYYKTKIAEKVAKLLGHKSGNGTPLWSTSVKSYIEPETTINFFDRLNVRAPKWAENLKDDED